MQTRAIMGVRGVVGVGVRDAIFPCIDVT